MLTVLNEVIILDAVRWSYSDCMSWDRSLHSEGYMGQSIQEQVYIKFLTRVYIKEVNDILKTKCSQSCFTFICPDSDWTLSNGSLDPDLFYLDNVHLEENGNLKLAASIFSLIKILITPNMTTIFSIINPINDCVF